MKLIVYLDDGHGIDTPGKRTPKFEDGSVMKENEFNEAVVSRLAELLCEQGIYTHFTAPEKENVPLNTRVNRANEHFEKRKERDYRAVFVSVHANAYKAEWGDWGGIETYYYDDKDKPLAAELQEHLLMGTALRDRGIKYGNFAVLRDTVMPAALVECGFMDNLKEATLLRSDAYREECALELCAGICRYFGINKKTALSIKIQLAQTEIFQELLNILSDAINELPVDIQHEYLQRLKEALPK